MDMQHCARELNRVDCLDGVRGLAALWVLVGHCFLFTGWRLPLLETPELGVDLFMMLSGFLMVFQYRLRENLEDWSRPGTWLKFWLRRFFRIAPLYYVLLFVALLLAPALLAWKNEAQHVMRLTTPPTPFLDRSPPNILAHASFVFGMIPSYAARTPLPDWSLSLEMQFYALFPFLMLMIRRIGWVPATVLGIAAASVASRLVWYFSLHYPMPAFLPFKLDIFMAGMMLALSCRQTGGTSWPYFIAALIFVFTPIENERSDEPAIVRVVMIAALFALTLHVRLPGMIGKSAFAVSNVLGSHPFKLMGDISYSTYLLHLLFIIPLGDLIMKHGGMTIPVGARSLALLALTALVVYPLSWVTFKCIELPGQSLGRKLKTRLASVDWVGIIQSRIA